MFEFQKPPRAETDDPQMRSFRNLATTIADRSATRAMHGIVRFQKALRATDDPRLRELEPVMNYTAGSASFHSSEAFETVGQWDLFWGLLETESPAYDLLRLGMVGPSGFWENDSAGYYVAGARQTDELIPFMNEKYLTDTGSYDQVRAVTVEEHHFLMHYIELGAGVSAQPQA